MSETHTGSCLCGSVSYTVDGPLRGVVACHCSQCRKQSGHYYAATTAPRDSVMIHGEERLRWYRASAMARRGFCGTCGSALFWQHDEEDRIASLAGSLDAPTGLAIEKHIYCADKGDYYDLTDGLPQYDRG